MPLRPFAMLAFLPFIAAGCSTWPKEDVRVPELSVSSLNQGRILGELGAPLGTVVEVRASIVAGSELQSKRHQGCYLLRITEVDGHPLAVPAVMEFTVPGFAGVQLASNDSDLYELKTGTKAGTLEPAQIERLREGYVGRQVLLAVYETGQYSGVPHNVPQDIPTWQDRGFGFRSLLVVLAERP